MSTTRNRVGIKNVNSRWKKCILCWLTYAQSQVQQSHPDIQPEEQNNIGHFAEQDDVAHVLLHSY